jgi:outer membrane protein insertion porin family
MTALASAQQLRGPGSRDQRRPERGGRPEGRQAEPETAFAPQPAPAGSPTIIGIEAKTQQAESLIVIMASGLERGDQLTRDNLAAAIRKIHATGLFSYVEADTFMLADGVRVLFRTRDLSRLKASGLHFIGNHKVSSRDLSGKLAAKEKDLLTEQQIFDWTQKIIALYKERGFVLVKVEPQPTPPDPKGRAEVNFFIEEGDQIRIKKIEIKGAKAIAEKTLLGKMVNRAYAWPFRGGKFNDQEFKKDLERITDLYKEKGYLDAKVQDYDLRYDQGWEHITITVAEGAKYYFGRLTFVGESLFTRPGLDSALRTKDGAVYNQKKVNQTLTDLYALYAEQGFIYASIQPADSIRGDTVDIRFRITENQPAKIRLVTIEGNDRTHEKVIRREIVSMPGSIFRRSEVIRSQQNVFNLGFFEDVQLDYRRVADTASDIDLTYKVKEKFAGSVGAGVSYSATEGIVGYLELTQPNLFGRAQRLHVKYEKGGKRQNVELGFTEPWLFDTPTSVGANVFYVTQSYGAKNAGDFYDRRDRGGEVNFSRPLPLDYARGYFTFHAGDVFITNSERPDVPNYTSPKTTISTTFRLDRDSRDYIFNPSSGSFHSYSLELAGGPLGGQTHYHKHLLESNLYYPLFWKFALRCRSRFGYISGYRSADTVPPYERFYPGGTGEDGLRGYPDRSLPNLTGFNQGGRTEAIFSLEYRLRLSRGLVVLAFLDAGNAWESIRTVNLSDLKRGAGAGVRLEIPMIGWLGFDMGYGFDQPDAGKRWQPHFQIGTSFFPTGF